MVLQVERDEHVLTLTLDRPEARNAVNGAVAQALEEALDDFEADGGAWVAILTGRGPVFSAGADLKAIAAGEARSLHTSRGGFAGLVERERTKPIIAAVNGPALAGGFELVLACDLAVAADTATFGLPEVKRSLAAAAGGLIRLPRIVGKALAMEMALTGEPVGAERALALGLVNAVVPAGEVMAAARALAARITANAPLAVQASRGIVEQAQRTDDEALWAACRDALGVLSKTEDFIEGPRAFIEKRPPVWRGR